MSVISRNPFDLLGDSEDSNQIPVSQPVVKKQQPVRETKPKDTTRAIPGENKRSDYPKRGGMATRGGNFCLFVQIIPNCEERSII